MKSKQKIGVLLMAYGSPNNVEEVADFFTNIRGGVRPPEPVINAVKKRYEAVGGQTPFLEITQAQVSALEKILNMGEKEYAVYVGMLHSSPYIKDVVENMYEDGIKNTVAIALAPHYSKMSVEPYIKEVENSITKGNNSLDFSFVKNWHMEPNFIESITDQLGDVLKNISPTDKKNTTIIFTAHSLPSKIRSWNDPYEEQLLETSTAVSKNFPKIPWTFAFQSAGRTKAPWLGPDLLETITKLEKEGTKTIVVCPVGFVSDHLEILYDIDIEAKAHAEKTNIKLIRVESRNTNSKFIEALATVVKKHC